MSSLIDSMLGPGREQKSEVLRRSKMSSEQYRVTQRSGTERTFENTHRDKRKALTIKPAIRVHAGIP